MSATPPNGPPDGGESPDMAPRRSLDAGPSWISFDDAREIARDVIGELAVHKNPVRPYEADMPDDLRLRYDQRLTEGAETLADGQLIGYSLSKFVVFTDTLRKGGRIPDSSDYVMIPRTDGLYVKIKLVDDLASAIGVLEDAFPPNSMGERERGGFTDTERHRNVNLMLQDAAVTSAQLPSLLGGREASQSIIDQVFTRANASPLAQSIGPFVPPEIQHRA